MTDEDDLLLFQLDGFYDMGIGGKAAKRLKALLEENDKLKRDKERLLIIIHNQRNKNKNRKKDTIPCCHHYR